MKWELDRDELGGELGEVKLGFVGCGKMGSALLRGVLDGGLVEPGEVTVFDSHRGTAEALKSELGVVLAAEEAGVFEASELVLICTKPGGVAQVLAEFRKVQNRPLLLSIAAGVTLEKMRKTAGPEARLVRAMPNTPALIGEGVTAFAAGSEVSEEERRLVGEVLGVVGEVVECLEGELDAVTGLSGSGPAYVYLFVEALTDAGVRQGLGRELARQLAVQTVRGAAGMVQKSGKHPAVLRDMVTSPGGTTIAGVQALEDAGLRAACFKAVEAATVRSRELGD